MSIQAVFFDMGGTIQTCWYDHQVRLAATPGLREILAGAGIDLGLNDEALCQVVSAGLERYRSWKNRTLLELAPERVWREFMLADFAVDPARLAKVAEALMFWVETRYYRREMRPEMPAVTDAIRQMGLKMGIISNTCSQGQVPHDLEQYGLRQLFDPVVLSCQYGRRKPDPAIFHYAARLANVPAGACVHVGDSIAKDIEGACRAGFRLAFQILNPSRATSGATNGIRPDVVVTRMDEILPALREELAHKGPRHARQVAGRRLRAILFDAGDVLYRRPNRGKKFHAFLHEIGHDPTAAPAASRESLKEQSVLGAIDQHAYREAMVRLHGVTDPDQVARGVRILEAEDNEVVFPVGARETLHALKQRGFLLGIVTDTRFPVSVKLSWLAEGGFGDVWDTIISSNELGIRKPDPRIYRAALSQLGVNPGEAAFVGHADAELDGAQAAGMATIAYNYAESTRADFYIDTFEDLLKVRLVAGAALEPQR